MIIRPFEPEDRPSVVELWRRCNLISPTNDPDKDIDRKRKVRPDLFLVAVIDGAIVGSVMVGYEGHRGWINYLGVNPACRRAGIGRALMTEAERLLRLEGCPKINLQVRTSNLDVLAFYRALGYKQDDVVSLGFRLEQDHAP
jgi:ribosomal protein S18 acetylase RimI-like enzyme